MKPDLIIQNHCIDDEKSTAELSLEQFRCAFPYTRRVNVWEDGKGITYEFRKGEINTSIINNARTIIKAQHLPLSISAYTNWKNDYFLMVSFKTKRE